MNIDRLGAWLQLFGSSLPDDLNEWEWIDWRANYDEARAIARYFQCAAGRKGQAGARQGHRKRREGRG